MIRMHDNCSIPTVLTRSSASAVDTLRTTEISNLSTNVQCQKERYSTELWSMFTALEPLVPRSLSELDFVLSRHKNT